MADRPPLELTFHDCIEAYVDRLSVHVGDQVGLHVSTTASSYDVVVERWGAQREFRWEARGVVGRFYEPPIDADAAGCRWPAAVTIPTAGWPPGFHLVTLTAAEGPPDRRVTHAGFVVRPAEPTSRALLVLATNTWNAYNTWGGASLYTGGHRVSFRRPWSRGLLDRPEVDRDDRKSRPVRFGEVPDVDGEIFERYRLDNDYSSAIGSTGWFTHERRFVEWAEQRGWSFDLAVSSDLDRPGALAGYDVVFGVGHDEYWSAPARDEVDCHIAAGGHYVSLSGNTMFWQVRLEADDAHSTGDDHMVCHKYRAHLADPVMTGAGGGPTTMSGLWCDPIVARPEWTTLGAGSVFGLYHRFGHATPRGSGGFTVMRHDHWLFADTGLGYGDVLGRDHGVVGYETVGVPLTLDEWQQPVARPVAGLPEDIEIVATCLSSNLGVGEYPASIAALSDQGDAEFLAERYYGEISAESLRRVRHGNAAMVVCRPAGSTGGEVITVGTTDWVYGLAQDALVSQVTDNICRRYLGDS